MKFFTRNAAKTLLTLDQWLNALTQSRKAPWILAALFGVFGCVASLQIPLYQGYDEGWHYAYVEHYALGRPLPNLNLHFTTGDVAAPYWQTHEATQPPLYYGLMARLAALVSREDLMKTGVLEGGAPNGMYGNFLPADVGTLGSGLVLAGHLVRFATVLMGAGVVLCAYFITLRVVQRADVAALVCAMTAFNPRMTVLSAQISNDMAVACAASLSLLLATVIVTTKNEVRWKQVAVLGVSAGVSFLMKYSGGAVMLAAIAALACHAWQRKLSWRWLGVHLIVLGLGALVVTGWYFLHNWQLYGDVLAWNKVNELNRHLAVPRTAQSMLNQLPFILTSFFAHPAYMLALPFRYTNLMFYGMCLAGCGLVWLALRRRRGVGVAYWPLLIALIANIVTHVAWMRTHPDTENTRFLSPTFVPITLLFVLGLLAFVPRRWQPAFAVVVSVMYGLFTGSTLYIGFSQMFARPNYLNPTESQRLLSQPPAGRVMFENGIELMDVQLKDNRLNVGEPIALSIVWRTTRPLTQSAHLMLDVRDAQGQTLTALNTSNVVRYSYVPRAWRVGELVREDYTLRPPMNRNQVVHVLAGWFWHNAQQSPIRPIDKDGPRNTVSVEIARVKLHVPYSAKSELIVGQPIAHIVGLADLLSAEKSAEGLVLRWRATAEPAQNYTVFVHGLDAQGAIVTQSDVPFEYPAAFWNIGEVFEQKILVKDLDLVKTIQIGVYEPVSLQRLRAVAANGAAWADDAVVVGR